MSLQSIALVLKKSAKQKPSITNGIFPELEHTEKFPKQICSRFLENSAPQKRASKGRQFKIMNFTLHPLRCSSLLDVTSILKKD